MAVIKTSNQQQYTGKGPLDHKALVKTYAELLDAATWTAGEATIAYNGMITAVWGDSITSNNGVYFLHDPEVKSSRGTPNVSVEANWHKLAEMTELADLLSRISGIEARLTALEAESDVITYGYRSGFPQTGEPNKLYVAADEGKSYIWFNDEYLVVSSADSGYEEPEVIYGGSADTLL